MRKSCHGSLYGINLSRAFDRKVLLVKLVDDLCLLLLQGLDVLLQVMKSLARLHVLNCFVDNLRLVRPIH